MKCDINLIEWNGTSGIGDGFNLMYYW